MKRNKVLSGIAIAAALTFVTAGCGSSEDSSDGGSGGGGGAPLGFMAPATTAWRTIALPDGRVVLGGVEEIGSWVS